jgi:hypothetical protein
MSDYLYCNECDECIHKDDYQLCELCDEYIRARNGERGFVCQDHIEEIEYRDLEFVLCYDCIQKFRDEDPQIMKDLDEKITEVEVEDESDDESDDKSE